MSGDKHPINVIILDKEYKILCKPDEAEALKLTAHFLDRKMREIKNSGKVVGAERIAIMAALNISHEFLCANNKSETYVQTMRERIMHLQEKISATLESSNPAHTLDESSSTV